MAKLACKLGLYSRECYHFWLQFIFNLQQIMDMQFPKRREASRTPGHIQAAAPATTHRLLSGEGSPSKSDTCTSSSLWILNNQAYLDGNSWTVCLLSVLTTLCKLFTCLRSLTSQTWHHDSIQIFKQHGESIYGLDVILPFMRSKSSAAPRKSSPSGVALKVCTTVLNLLKPRCTNCHSHPLLWGLSLVTSYGGCQISVRPLFEVDSLLKKILCCQ
jgi:hypothetical protein